LETKVYGKLFFSEEKNQKTFMSCARGQTEAEPASRNPREELKVFLLLLFKTGALSVSY